MRRTRKLKNERNSRKEKEIYRKCEMMERKSATQIRERKLVSQGMRLSSQLAWGGKDKGFLTNKSGKKRADGKDSGT